MSGQGNEPNQPSRFPLGAGRGIGMGRGALINQPQPLRPGVPAGRGAGFSGALGPGLGRGFLSPSGLSTASVGSVEPESQISPVPTTEGLGRGILIPGIGIGRGSGRGQLLGVGYGQPQPEIYQGEPDGTRVIARGRGLLGPASSGSSSVQRQFGGRDVSGVRDGAQQPVPGQFLHDLSMFEAEATNTQQMASLGLGRGLGRGRGDDAHTIRRGGLVPHEREKAESVASSGSSQHGLDLSVTAPSDVSAVTTAGQSLNTAVGSGGTPSITSSILAEAQAGPEPEAHAPAIAEQQQGVPEPELAQADVQEQPALVVVGEPAGEESEEVVLKKKTYRGDKGVPFQVLTNFLRVEVREDKKLYEYTVTFNPTIDATRTKREAIRNVEHLIGDARQFDGTKMWLPRLLELENDAHCIVTHLPNDPSQELTMSFCHVKEVTMKNCIQFYNVALRKALRAMGYTEIQRDYYDSEGKEYLSKSRLIMWPGVITAIEEYEDGLMLCLEQTHKVMRETTLLDLYNQEFKHKPNGMKLFTEAILRKVVMTTYNNLCYKVDDVTVEQTPMTTFPRTRNGVTTEISYVDYFRQQHGKHITDLNQPIILSKKKAKKNDPQGEFIVGIIPELCVLTGLTEQERGNFTLMKEIIDKSRIPPNQRRTATKKFLEKLQNTPEALKQLDAWGISISNKPVVLSARPVVPPGIIINPTCQRPAATADFSREVTTNKCLQPIPLKKWIIFCGQADKSNTQRFVTTYRSVINALGITMESDPLLVIIGNAPRPFNANELRLKLREMVNKESAKEIQFVVTILPMARDDLYGAVKKHCVLENSMPSQVILGKTIANDKRLRSVVQKVALQINCKLGGALWGLNITMKDEIMFIGIDSHHCPDRNKSSMLGLVATLDNQCTKHFSKVISQIPHQEDADAIKPLFAQALAVYNQTNGYYPNRVVVFRDGVGDSQLKVVVENEVQQLKSLCLQFNKNMRFYFIVVQKRINERYFIRRGPDLDNPPPGSVLDHTITRRNFYDFFLVSQLVRQGTVSPTHYIVLEDSGDRRPDLTQRFAFSLTFMYFNWPGTIRVPAVCQYAHKLAMLAGQHLGGMPSSDMDRMLWYL